MAASNDFQQEIEASLKELAIETDNVKKTTFFKEYLDVMSRFWDYSYHNQLLIYFQKKDATDVAGFCTWKKLGRFVKGGEKAIKILAPFKIKVPIKDNGEEKLTEFTRFYPVNVFDIAQTEGKDLPSLEVSVEGDDQHVLLEKLAAFCEERSIKLEYKKLGVNKLYGYSMGGQIVVSSELSVNGRVATLIHEIAHELIHKDEERAKLSRQQKEIQAEGTAYVVLKSLGLPSKGFNYLALYDADYKKIMENLEVIASASRVILGAIIEGKCLNKAID